MIAGMPRNQLEAADLISVYGNPAHCRPFSREIAGLVHL
jgi:hypothetical protein